jgi:hypothetical protein
MIANESQATGIERQGQLELRMVVPLKWNAVVQTAIQHAPRRLRWPIDLFEERLHQASCTVRTPEKYQESPHHDNTARAFFLKI